MTDPLALNYADWHRIMRLVLVARVVLTLPLWIVALWVLLKYRFSE